MQKLFTQKVYWDASTNMTASTDAPSFLYKIILMDNISRLGATSTQLVSCEGVTTLLTDGVQYSQCSENWGEQTLRRVH